MTTNNYCTLCGNEQTAAPDQIGPKCRKLIEGPLENAYRFWEAMGARERYDSGGINSQKTGILFHGKYWEATYPPNVDTDAILQVSVSMGAVFYRDHVETYWVFNTEHDSSGITYGDSIPLPKSIQSKRFWKKLDAQLNRAAEAAFHSDTLSCIHCGQHYNSAVDQCNCEGAEAEQEEEEANV